MIERAVRRVPRNSGSGGEAGSLLVMYLARQRCNAGCNKSGRKCLTFEACHGAVGFLLIDCAYLEEESGLGNDITDYTDPQVWYKVLYPMYELSQTPEPLAYGPNHWLWLGR